MGDKWEDFMRELSLMDADEMMGLYIEAKTGRKDGMSLIPLELSFVATESIKEVLFVVNKTMGDELLRYKITMPPEIRKLLYLVEKPLRQSESFKGMLEYFDPEPMTGKEGEIQHEQLHDSARDSEYINDTIYNKKGNWDKILEDPYIQELLSTYQI